jgi:NAD(P)-dependent dehydrogenase (short-subunit alcohol dehydrogenase family)
MVIPIRMGQYLPMFPRTALVTGSASGIGAALVTLLRAERAEVQALDVAEGFDVADARAWERVGPVELACLNAGVTTGTTDIRELTDEAYDRIRSANLDGVVYGVRRLAGVMQPGSAIVATASLAGLTPMALDPIYTLTKHAVVGWVRAAAPALQTRRVRINCICPGFADTPLLTPDARRRFEEASFPLLEPEGVARAALAAATDPETGQAFVVQPGRPIEAYRFRGVPGPRAEGAEGMEPPRLGERAR